MKFLPFGEGKAMRWAASKISSRIVDNDVLLDSRNAQQLNQTRPTSTIFTQQEQVSLPLL
ncbi:hypothetical protein Y887_16205 [Xanthomonas pisi DSM 18956]|nr:hypothetical protein Y887_16205 [Xanthomonas pisi DSM 18956]